MIATLRVLFWSSRPISWVNTAYPFAATYILINRELTWQLVAGTFFFLIPYNLLLYGVNDVFDYESDIRNPRKGGIEGAKVTKQYHRVILWSAALLNLPFVLMMLAWGDASARLTLILVLFTVLAYSVPKLRFKERPIIDSLTSSSHFTGPLLYALVLSGWQVQYWPFVLAFFLWGMASHAFGAVQDIAADREGGLASIGTVLGARITTRFAIIMYVLATAVLIRNGIASAICGLTGLLYAANALPYWNIGDQDAEQANKAWRRFIWLNMITGFVVTMVLIQVYMGNLR